MPEPVGEILRHEFKVNKPASAGLRTASIWVAHGIREDGNTLHGEALGQFDELMISILQMVRRQKGRKMKSYRHVMLWRDTAPAEPTCTPAARRCECNTHHSWLFSSR